MLGMTLAHRLAQRGRRVTLIEAAGQLGGLAAPWRLGEVEWDRHYHVILASDARLLALLAELGLADELVWRPTRTGAYGDGRLHSVSNTVELLRFPLLSPVDKLRLAATVFYASRIRDGRRLERIPVADWLRRWSGRRTLERFWLPLLRSKLGGSYRQTSAAFIWATIARLYAARRAGLKQELLGYVRGGYARVLARFAATLTAAGVEMRLGEPVARIAAAGGGAAGSGIAVDLAGGERLRFDQVVVTLAAPLAARVCEGLAPEERERLNGVRYLGIVCASLLLRRPLAGFYVTNLLDAGLPFTGVVEMSALVDSGDLGGHSLVYLPRYLAPDDPFFAASDAEVEELFTAALGRIFAGFRREDVAAFRVSRVRQVMALPTLDYSARLPPVTTSVPGLHLASSAHIVNGTLNVNETVDLAERTAERLLQDAGSAARAVAEEPADVADVAAAPAAEWGGRRGAGRRVAAP
ncbi:MAG: FAD-dependent oxidoreductase [Acidobacteria bacterium]|nr:FAD-dependent oxidoreductase [Acidobacteriota bacterium]